MKRAIIIVTFGTANLNAYNIIDKFRVKLENRLKVDVKIVFTSNMLIKIMKEKNSINVCNIEDSIKELVLNNYESVIIQPLHMMEGAELLKLKESIKIHEQSFKKLIISSTLFNNIGKNPKESTENFINCIKHNIDKDKNILLIGHGSNESGNECYDEIEKAFKDSGYNKVIIGTLEGIKTKDIIVKRLLKEKIDKVEIMILLILPGNHIIKDIKGENSWEELLINNGIEVTFNIKALLEYDEIQELYFEILKCNID